MKKIFLLLILATNARAASTLRTQDFSPTATDPNVRNLTALNITVGSATAQGLSGFKAVELTTGSNSTLTPTSLAMRGFGASPVVSVMRTNGTSAAPTVLTAGNILGSLFWDGFAGAGSSSGKGNIEVYAENTYTLTDAGGSMQFRTHPRSTAIGTMNPVRMVITSTGIIVVGNMAVNSLDLTPTVTAQLQVTPDAAYPGASAIWANGRMLVTGSEVIVSTLGSAGSGMVFDVRNASGTTLFNVQNSGSIVVAGSAVVTNNVVASGNVSGVNITASGTVSASSASITNTATAATMNATSSYQVGGVTVISSTRAVFATSINASAAITGNSASITNNLAAATLTASTATLTGQLVSPSVKGGTSGAPSMLINTDASFNNSVSAGGILIAPGGGANTSIVGDSTVICSGNCQVTGSESFVGGGDNNDITGTTSGIVAGTDHSITGSNSGIFSGSANTITADGAVIVGGSDNSIPLGADTGIFSCNNCSAQSAAVVIGGVTHVGSGLRSAILGGEANETTDNADRAVILGGTGNTIDQSPDSGILSSRNSSINGTSSSVIIGGSNGNVGDSSAILLNAGTGGAGTGNNTIDNYSEAGVFFTGTGAPPDGFALCLDGGRLGHCTSIVGVTGGCTCTVP